MAGRTSDSAPAWLGDRGGHIWPKDREVEAPDGARIRYAVFGADSDVTIALCAGFMCPDNFWADIAPPLSERYRMVVFNYRGVGASTDPRTPGWRARRVTSDDYTIEKMAGDLLAILDAEGIERVVPLGHSMGCQVALEVVHADPDRVAALVLVTGPYASPLHTFYGRKIGAYLFPFAYAGAKVVPMPLLRALPYAVRLPIAMRGARLLRALGPHTPDQGMDLYFQHFPRVNPLIALKIAKGMHRFDAGPWLDQVDAPTLIVIGGRDTFTPRAIGDVLLERIPTSEVLELPEGTHGAAIEFPHEIVETTLDFLERHLAQ